MHRAMSLVHIGRSRPCYPHCACSWCPCLAFHCLVPSDGCMMMVDCHPSALRLFTVVSPIAFSQFCRCPRGSAIGTEQDIAEASLQCGRLYFKSYSSLWQGSSMVRHFSVADPERGAVHAMLQLMIGQLLEAGVYKLRVQSSIHQIRCILIRFL